MVKPAVQDPLWMRLDSDDELSSRRDSLLRMRDRYLPYADDNFGSELTIQFGSCFWEMYVGCAMLSRGFDLLRRSERPAGGPDLCILDAGRQVWVEAVAPRPGTGADAVPAMRKSGWVPEDQIVLRYRSAVEDKYRKRSKYVETGMISADDPFLVAVNGFQISHGTNAFPDEIPYAVQSVLPLGRPSVTVDAETGAVLGQGYQTRRHIQKRSGVRISTDVFLDPAYAGLTGLLFSGAKPLYVDLSAEGFLSHLHNPSAPRPSALAPGWIRRGREYWVEGNELHERRCPGA
jgi:hypothetical protein